MKLSRGDKRNVDHISGNTLDNRKINLRTCTKAENTRNQKMNKRNTSGIKGVTFNKRAKKWRTQIKVNNKSIHLGYFINKEDAGKAYEQASIKYHGCFRRNDEHY